MEALNSYLLGTLPELVPAEVRAKYPNDKTGQINTVLGTNPLLFDRYLDGAIEVDVDALCDGKDVFVCGIMEHIEEAGVHSGDSACSLPPFSLGEDMLDELKRQTRALALALEVGGLMNVQYAIKGGEIYVLEVNPRASRTVPFVAKTIGEPVAKIASRIMAGESLASFGLTETGHSTISPSRKPCSRLPVSRASTPFSARKCGLQARSWASTPPSVRPSPSRRSAPARVCPVRERCLSPCVTRTSPAWSTR